MSGGNAQKVVLARQLVERPKVLVLAEPTQGVDVGAKEEIHRIITELADDGTAVLVVTSDLPRGAAHLRPAAGGARAARTTVEFGPDATQVDVLAAAAGDEQAQAEADAAGLRGSHPPMPPRRKETRREHDRRGRAGRRRPCRPTARRILPSAGHRPGAGADRRDRRALGRCSAFATPAFLTAGSIQPLLVAVAPIALIGIGMTIVIITGGIDVSVGGAIMVCSVVTAKLLVDADVPLSSRSLLADRRRRRCSAWSTVC